MKTWQVQAFYQDKEKVSCPLTEKLLQGGYRQERGGYVAYARQQEARGETVPRQGNWPSQWWHLMVSYCERTDKDISFTKRIQCGELLFWMAEAGSCVDRKALEELADRILDSAVVVQGRKGARRVYRRRTWNREIQRLCFDAIVETVEKACPEQ